MERIAVFPGSFDPVTKGHVDILSRATRLFDKIIIAVGENANKKYMFSLEQRMAWLKETFQEYKNVEVVTFTGLTVDFAKSVNANFLLRGLRSAPDLEFENNIARANREMNPDLDTVFLVASAHLSFISSSIARDIIKNKGDYTLFVPDAVRI